MSSRGTSDRNLGRLALVTLLTTSLFAAGGLGCEPTYRPAAYPVVLAHGFSGFDSLVGIEYFYGVKKALQDAGNKVCVTEVSAYNSIEVRGTQLADEVEECLAIHGAQKLNIIGHSMGGLDARYAATNVLGASKIASITTIATPHRGSEIADILAFALDVGGALPGAEILNFILSELGGDIINGEIQLPQDVNVAVHNLTEDFATAFSAATPDLPGVLYYSYAGTRQVAINLLDPSDTILSGLSTVVFPFEPDDGLLPVSSAAWGTTVDMNLRANHLDEINHLLGNTSGFDAKGLYLEIADMLAGQGL